MLQEYEGNDSAAVEAVYFYASVCLSVAYLSILHCQVLLLCLCLLFSSAVRQKDVECSKRTRANTNLTNNVIGKGILSTF